MSRFQREWYSEQELETRCRRCGIRPLWLADRELLPPADSSDGGQPMWRATTARAWVYGLAVSVLVYDPEKRKREIQAQREHYQRYIGGAPLPDSVFERDVYRSFAVRTVRRFFGEL